MQCQHCQAQLQPASPSCPYCGQAVTPANVPTPDVSADAVPPLPAPVQAEPPSQATPVEAVTGHGPWVTSPPQGDATGGVIPYKNPPALTAYYLGIFSIVPCLGIVLGIAAVILGIKGLRNYKATPIVSGRVHAYVGIICGGLFALLWIGLLLFTFVVGNL